VAQVNNALKHCATDGSGRVTLRARIQELRYEDADADAGADGATMEGGAVVADAGRVVALPPPLPQPLQQQAVAVVRIEVEDNGPGIPPEEQSRLFAPFAVGSGATGSLSSSDGGGGGGGADRLRPRAGGNVPQGTGLGLSICKDIVGAHGGRVGVVSRPRHGATFYAEVPLPVVTADGDDKSDDASDDGDDHDHAGGLGARSGRGDDAAAVGRRRDHHNRRQPPEQQPGVLPACIVSADGAPLLAVAGGAPALPAVPSAAGGAGTAAADVTTPVTVTTASTALHRSSRGGASRTAASARTLSSPVSLTPPSTEGAGAGGSGTPASSSSNTGVTAEAPPATGSRTRQPLPPPARRLRFLVVDDAASNRMLLARVLRSRWPPGSLAVDEAADGAKAVAAVQAALSTPSPSQQPPQPQQAPYDVILMDGQMPVMDGRAATAAIRAATAGLPPHARPLIVGCTGSGLDDDVRAFLDAGADDIVVKPVAAPALHATLLRLLSGRPPPPPQQMQTPPQQHPPLASGVQLALPLPPSATPSAATTTSTLARPSLAHIHVPAPPAVSPATGAAAAAASASSSPPLRFLLVDDVLSNRRLLGRVIKARWPPGAVTVDEAADGAEAVAVVTATLAAGDAAAGSHPPLPRPPHDVILMDASMSVMDGLAATAAIRAATVGLPPHARPLILGVTGNGLDVDVRAFRDAGAQDVLIKPVAAAQLQAAVTRLLHERREQRLPQQAQQAQQQQQQQQPVGPAPAPAAATAGH
jgi:CheY-like chemotaxis protein